jgi:hypothetical protein
MMTAGEVLLVSPFRIRDTNTRAPISAGAIVDALQNADSTTKLVTRVVRKCGNNQHAVAQGGTKRISKSAAPKRYTFIHLGS